MPSANPAYCVFTLYGRSVFLQFLINKYSLNVANLYFAITGSKVNIKKLFEMSAGQKCCVIGTLFKSMELKPNILKEISKDVSIGATLLKLDSFLCCFQTSLPLAALPL